MKGPNNLNLVCNTEIAPPSKEENSLSWFVYFCEFKCMQASIFQLPNIQNGVLKVFLKNQFNKGMLRKCPKQTHFCTLQGWWVYISLFPARVIVVLHTDVQIHPTQNCFPVYAVIVFKKRKKITHTDNKVFLKLAISWPHLDMFRCNKRKTKFRKDRKSNILKNFMGTVKTILFPSSFFLWDKEGYKTQCEHLPASLGQ